MAFLDQLAGNFNKVRKDLTGKTQKLSEIVKLNSKINDANALIKSTFAAIGETYFEKYGTDETNEFADQFKIVSETRAAIAEYKAEIMKIKGVAVCAGCGSEISKDVSFCPKCGCKVEKPAEEAPAEEAAPEKEKTCSVCNEHLEEDAAFCTNCGAPVEAEEKTEAPAEE